MAIKDYLDDKIMFMLGKFHQNSNAILSLQASMNKMIESIPKTSKTTTSTTPISILEDSLDQDEEDDEEDQMEEDGDDEEEMIMTTDHDDSPLPTQMVMTTFSDEMPKLNYFVKRKNRLLHPLRDST